MTKVRYLLPGERDNTSCIVHTHGFHRDSSSSNSSTNSKQNDFISIPRVYVPKVKDCVIGIVIVRTPDLFLVDINSNETAVLPIPSFDNGRLPSRAAMNRLSVVYAHVVRTDSWTQAELSCQSYDRTKRKSEFGLVEHGNIIRCSLGLVNKLRQSSLVNRLYLIVKDLFIRVAQNGFIWYKTDTINSMVALRKVFYRHEYDNNVDELINYYHQLMNQLQQQDNIVVCTKRIQYVEKQETPIEKPAPPADNALTRLTNNVIHSVLDKIIDDIEHAEKQ